MKILSACLDRTFEMSDRSTDVGVGGTKLDRKASCKTWVHVPATEPHKHSLDIPAIMTCSHLQQAQKTFDFNVKRAIFNKCQNACSYCITSLETEISFIDPSTKYNS